MLTGKQAFEGDSAIDTISSIIHKEPMSLSQLVPDIPPQLQHLVEKSLRKDREERYQTARDLLIDLKDIKQDLQLQNQLERTASPNREESKTQILNATTADVSHTTSSAEYVVNELKSRKSSLAIGLIVLILASVGLGYWFFINPSSNTKGNIDSIAVMPFVNQSGNADNEYLSDGMTESLINSLSQLPKLAVKARSSVFRYKGKDIEPQTIGNELSVQAVLNGRVVQRGENLTLSLELVDTKTGNQIWGEQYNRKFTDIVSLQNEIAKEVSNKLRQKLSGVDEQKLTKNYPISSEAYEVYLQGLYHWNKRTNESVGKANEYFQKAIEKDPNYALAYVGLANSYIVMPILPAREANPKAKAAALKALEIDDSLGEAHAVLANTAFYYEYDWTNAEREYKKAIELSPNYPTVHHWYGESLTCVGRFDESFAEYKRALELDPLSFAISTD
jgi:TolB-like protein